jgi:hypothetical protein
VSDVSKLCVLLARAYYPNFKPEFGGQNPNGPNLLSNIEEQMQLVFTECDTHPMLILTKYF